MRINIAITFAALCVAGSGFNAFGGAGACGKGETCGLDQGQVQHTCTEQNGTVRTLTFICTGSASRSKWVADSSGLSKVDNTVRCGSFTDHCGTPQICGPGVVVSGCTGE